MDVAQHVIDAVRRAFAAGDTALRQRLDEGTVAAQRANDKLWRIAIFNNAQARIAFGHCTGFAVGRTVAEVLRGGPSGFDPFVSDEPRYSVAEVARWVQGWQPNLTTFSDPSEDDITVRTSDVALGINACELSASTVPGAHIRLWLRGPWRDNATALVADAMLRDLAAKSEHPGRND